MPILDLDNEELVAEYENFVKTSPYGHMMQSVNWAQVKNNWDRDYVYLRDSEGKMQAALSILSVKNDGKNAFMYAPRGPVCDFSDLPLVERLLSEAEEIAVKRNAFLLRIDPEIDYNEETISAYRSAGHNIRSREQNDEKTFSNPRNHMILDIKDKTIDDVMASFPSKQRNIIRKTYKRNLVTRRITTDSDDFDAALNTFYSLTKEMAARQGITHRPYDYFQRLLHAFDDAHIFETIDDELEVLSSCIVVNYNKKAFYIYAASSNNKRNYSASVQTNFEAIKYSIEQNMEEYDFGGVYHFDTSDGLYTFKYHFCGKEGRKEMLGELDVVYNNDLYTEFIK